MTAEETLALIQEAEALLTAALGAVATGKATWSAADMATVTANLAASEARLAAAKAQADADAA